MGIKYSELSVLGRLRKESKLGPYSMFRKLVDDWQDERSPRQVAELVKNFHHWYCINRHKSVTALIMSLEQLSVELTIS
jgi:NAD+ synthase (glutamine-hydrolysing)